MNRQVRFVVSHPFAKNAKGWGTEHFLVRSIFEKPGRIRVVISQVSKSRPGVPNLAGKKSLEFDFL
jgi:hypothetical protein